MANTDVAGVVAVPNWNSVQTGTDWVSQATPTGAGQITVSGTAGIVNAAGAASSVGYTLASYGYLKSGGCAVTGSNGKLVAGGGVTRGTGSEAPLPVVLKLSGLNPDHAYEFLVYTSGGPNELTYASLSLAGGSTYYFQTGEGDGASSQLTTLQNHSSTNNVLGSNAAGTPIPNPETLISNYIEFDGVTGSTATLTLTELGAWPYGSWAPVPAANSNVVIGISGVQIIDTGKKGAGAR